MCFYLCLRFSDKDIMLPSLFRAGAPSDNPLCLGTTPPDKFPYNPHRMWRDMAYLGCCSAAQVSCFKMQLLRWIRLPLQGTYSACSGLSVHLVALHAL